ncbi:alpha/beta hydrolase [Danxiaibacter flavus]|uniref:Alpha/beta hydrolase n=1 Tax=Danxiaibacter flavus TaxID=3049108 RepID=A0ABV3ZLB0_9BACT|nr:alpha/beta hydrolase [Chitinophagaceae bacterium DXS]
MKRSFFSALIILSALLTSINSWSAGTGSRNESGNTKTVNVNNANIAYRIYGDKEGIPIVLLSPLGSSMDDWDPAVINGLTRNSPVVVFDEKGVGSSSGKTPATIAEMATDAIAFIKTLGYPKVNLLGFSMGGFVAQQIVETEPQWVNKLILVGTGPQGSEGLSEVGNKISSIANLPPEEQFLQSLFTPTEQSRQSGKESFARISAKKEGRDLPLSQEAFVAELTAVLGWAQPDSAAFARSTGVTTHTLIVAGKNDLLVPIVNPFKLYQAMPNSRLLLLPDAGHGVMFQYPDLFVQEAENFLKN